MKKLIICLMMILFIAGVCHAQVGIPKVKVWNGGTLLGKFGSFRFPSGTVVDSNGILVYTPSAVGIGDGHIDDYIIGYTTAKDAWFTGITIEQSDVQAQYWRGRELSDNGVGYRGFQVPDSITNSYTFQFCDADPATSIMSFGAPSGGQSAQTWIGVSTLATLTGTQTLTNKIIDQTIEAKVAVYPVLFTDMGKMLTNEGEDAEANIMTLPEASTVLGQSVSFAAIADFDVIVNPNDATDYIYGATDDAGDGVSLDTVGDTVTVMAVSANIWVVTSSYGTLAKVDNDA